jgi:hypothetical protein
VKCERQLANNGRENGDKGKKNEILRAPYFETKAGRIQNMEYNLQHKNKIRD